MRRVVVVAIAAVACVPGAQEARSSQPGSSQSGSSQHRSGSSQPGSSQPGSSQSGSSQPGSSQPGSSQPGSSQPGSSQPGSSQPGSSQSSSQRPSQPPTSQPSSPPWLGILFDPAAPTAHVTTVVPKSPAARAGIAPGDDVVAIDGHATKSSRDVIALVTHATAGSRVIVTISRTGHPVQIPVRLEPRPDPRQLAYDTLINQPAPTFDLPVVANSGSAKLADLAGKVVLVDFWATWCGPCADAVPEIEALHEKYAARGLRVVGISDDDAADIASYARDHAITYPLARDKGDVVAGSYWRAAIPMLVLIDRAGIVRSVGADRSQLEAMLVKLL